MGIYQKLYRNFYLKKGVLFHIGVQAEEAIINRDEEDV